VTRCPSARAALEAAVYNADILITWGVQNLAELVRGLSISVVLVSHGSGDWSIRAVRSSESGASHFAAVSEPALLPFSPEIGKRAVVIHNGIDVERATPTVPRRTIRSQWGLYDHHRLIGYDGRYSGEKNLAAAAWAVKELGGEFHTLYAGEGYMEWILRQQVPCRRHQHRSPARMRGKSEGRRP
jgi:glycosyltransferase involved in cell wall biosynthesis